MDKYRCNWWGLQIWLSVYGSEQLHTKLLDNTHCSLMVRKIFLLTWLFLTHWPDAVIRLAKLLFKELADTILAEEGLFLSCFVPNRTGQSQTRAKTPGDIIEYKTCWRLYAFNLFGLFCRSMKDLPWHKCNWFLSRPVCLTPVTGRMIQGSTITGKT